ncbi:MULTISPECIES: N(5)-(carboxyethyl)ornithine synthase [Thermomonosporaceae]|uniref:N(5)-(carboxyethyl)ornithine synthase n=1 Tax=Thermomonosporaceae TaxID=2012 RepID=UPI00255AB780|nr:MULTISPECIES: N(5)-(carboxyethyl)ornithine synthase [Thermomonosporaceae]MDL4772904.1 N(5)-(carboxyethyl)ornithine synthase [Actinomadura xylanilytica]
MNSLPNRLSLGVIAGSRKENERRLPLHPLHLGRLDPAVRSRVYLESGYGERFGLPDERLAPQVAGILPRARLIADCDVILLPKPQPADLAELRDGQVLWGWPHCVQDREITQLAIDKRLTLIAFEAMNHWSSDGGFSLHVFHKNNELAGYSSVLHALALTGTTGRYGPRRRAAIISFGATARGAVTALNALGVHDVDVLTQRGLTAVASPIHSARMVHFDHEVGAPGRTLALVDGGAVPMASFLAEHDIVVNCVLQDTSAPLMFATNDDLGAFAPGTLIVDVSCDEGMGFGWARPTSFEDPMFSVGDNVHYYGVDHSPSYLWDSATWEISEALLPHLETVLSGPAGWDADQTIQRAIEIRDGVVQNAAVLSFQDRAPRYPHPPATSAGAPAPATKAFAGG